MKKGYGTCPCPQIPAQQLEDVIVQQIRVVGHPAEQARVIQLLVERIDHDAVNKQLGPNSVYDAASTSSCAASHSRRSSRRG